MADAAKEKPDQKMRFKTTDIHPDGMKIEKCLPTLIIGFYLKCQIRAIDSLKHFELEPLKALVKSYVDTCYLDKQMFQIISLPLYLSPR